MCNILRINVLYLSNLPINGGKSLIVSECARRGVVSALLPEDEPEQHDQPPGPPHPDRHHHCAGQLCTLLCRISNAGDDAVEMNS